MIEILFLLAFLFLGGPLLLRETVQVLDRKRYQECLANIDRLEFELGMTDVLAMAAPYLWWRAQLAPLRRRDAMSCKRDVELMLLWGSEDGALVPQGRNYRPVSAASCTSPDITLTPGAVWPVHSNNMVQTLNARGLLESGAAAAILGPNGEELTLH